MSRPRTAGKTQSIRRFDFSKGTSVDDTETGTLRELLDELDSKYDPQSDAAITLYSLEANLGFIGQLTGRTYASLTEALPLSTLKTIKLLYLQNKASRIQLFRHLRSPHQGARATLEARITGNAPRNQTAVKAINAILPQLACEIAPERLAYIDGVLLTPAKLLECIKREDDDVLEPLYAAFGHLPPLLVEAVRRLTQAIIVFTPPPPAPRELPLNEVLYTHLRALPLLHFVVEYKNILRLAQLKSPVRPLHEEIARFCDQISKSLGRSITPGAPITSIEGFSAFVDEHSRRLGTLVKHATGIPTQGKDLRAKRDLAVKILHACIFHRDGKVPLSDIRLSASDCVAALCTIRQLQTRGEKIPYTPEWPGQLSSEITDYVLGQLDGRRSIVELYEEDYIPHGAMQLVYHRFCALYAALFGSTEDHLAWLQFRIARLEAYAKCHTTADIDAIARSVQELNEDCHSFAVQIARYSTK